MLTNVDRLECSAITNEGFDKTADFVSLVTYFGRNLDQTFFLGHGTPLFRDAHFSVTHRMRGAGGMGQT